MTTTIFGILVFLIYSALIVGLFKPALILRTSKNPTRKKILWLWLASIFIVPILSVIIIADEDLTQNRIDIATENINKENYSTAIESLSKIKGSDPLYEEAQNLIKTADSLKNLKLEIKRKAKEEAEAEEKENNLVKQKEQLIREIKSIDKGVNFKNYRGTVDDLQLELVLFGTWANIIVDGENSTDEEIMNLAKQLKSKVIAIQKREFPILRKNYAKIVAQKMWENDIEVHVSGTGNRYINITGGIFAANKNKKDFQNTLHEVLTMFRFNQSRYRWYKGEDEYTYWTIYEGKDTDLVDFK